jgi:hypothetical protein
MTDTPGKVYPARIEAFDTFGWAWVRFDDDETFVRIAPNTLVVR